RHSSLSRFSRGRRCSPHAAGRGGSTTSLISRTPSASYLVAFLCTPQAHCQPSDRARAAVVPSPHVPRPC
uniref:Uncharacterized protein n=1 Tax=Aegilops tauschii subsp. strangulata TaxID=200361 RepID=A0A453NPD0_AEGTS